MKYADIHFFRNHFLKMSAVPSLKWLVPLLAYFRIFNSIPLIYNG